MEALSRWVLARRRLVGLLTLTLLLAGGAAIALLLPQVSERNAYPGLPGFEANQRITATYGTGGYERPVVPVVTLPEGSTVDSARAALRSAFAAVTSATGARVAGYADTGDRGFVGADGRTTFGLVFGGPVEQGGLPGSALGEGAGLEPAIAAAMRPHLPAGAELRITGLDALATAADTGGLNVGVKLLITIGAAILVLAWVFRSALALVPLLTAVIAIPVSFLGLLAASLVIEVHETTLIMLPLFGIGIGIDYALILVSRWREERGNGLSGDEAVHRAMATAGHAVLFSAGAVAIGLLTMVVLPIPLLRSLGVGGMLVTLTSAAVSLTVLPLLLARARPGTPRPVGRTWFSWARLVVRYRAVAAVLAAGVLLALSAAALDLNLRVPTTDHLATEGPGREGLTALQRNGIPSGVLTAFDVYLPPGQAPEPLRATLAGLPGVHAVTAPVHRDGAALLTVLPVAEGGSAVGEDTINRVIGAAPGALVGGNVRQQMDYVTATYTAFPWMLAVLALLSYVLLARAFRSLLLPLKAILLNLLSLGAVLGAMVLLWQWGWGTEELLGLRPDGAIGTFVPVTIFAFLYGLTMDYEVFLIARMREEHDRTGDTEHAVVEGIGRTGRLITSAALILFCSFAAMATGGELDVAIFASGVALGILLDATLIRSVLVPATVAMLGRWNWWLPAWAARLLRLPAENSCR